MQGLLTGLCQA
ncbi:hypothetical protein LINGRAHAP2_LOCUS34484 [Linum grandiflorum]